ncbi:helix-turn-helix domain-containing protein [Flavobacterium sp. U410]
MIEHPELKLKRIRELKNLSQEHIANQLGLSIRAYSKIETGETQLTINRLNEISRILGISAFEILGFDNRHIFNINSSIGNNGYNYIAYSEKLTQQYEETIRSLKEQIELLKFMLDKINCTKMF